MAMTDIPNAQPDSRDTTILDAPDKMVGVREMFGIDLDMEVPAFSEADERVPDLDPAYVFDRDTTLAVLAGFAHNRRVIDRKSTRLNSSHCTVSRMPSSA